MALVVCPECNKQISDSAFACPHCGYSSPNAQNVLKKTRFSDIERTKSYAVIGAVIVAIGVISVYYGLFILSSKIGYISVFMGVFVAVIGAILVIGQVKFSCPYCGKENRVKKSAVSVKCRFCEKTSVREENRMKTVD